MNTIQNSVSYRKIWLLAFPIIISGLADNINNIINLIFVGRLGNVAIDAVGMGGLFYITFAIILFGLSNGAQIIIGRRNGEGKYTDAGRVFAHSILLFACIGILLFAFLYFFAGGILGRFISSREVYAACISYLQIRMVGLLFFPLMVAFRFFYIGIERTAIITPVTFFTAGLNVLLDYTLIFGHFGFQPMGIRGAAYASCIAEFSGFCAYLFVSIIYPFVKKYKIFHFGKFDMAIWGNILRIGSPLMLQTWMSVSSWMLLFFLIEKMGEQPLAVSQIIKNLYLLFLIPIWGFSASASTLTSNLIGEGKIDEVMPMVKKVILLSLITMIVLIQGNIFFPETILSLFSKKPDVISQSVAPLRVVSAALIFYCSGYAFFSVISGAGATRIALLIEMGTIAIYLFYSVLVTTVWHSSLAVVWTTEWVYMILIGSASYLYLRTDRWKKAKV